MGFLSQYEDTEILDFGSDPKTGVKYYVEVRVFLPSDAELEAQRKLTKIGVKNVDSKTEVTTDFDQGAYTKEMAAQALVNWNLTDSQDKILPFGSIEEKRLSIGRLPKHVIDRMLSVIKDKPDEDRGPDFRAGGDGSGPDGESGPSDPGGVPAPAAVLE